MNTHNDIKDTTNPIFYIAHTYYMVRGRFCCSSNFFLFIAHYTHKLHTFLINARFIKVLLNVQRHLRQCLATFS